MTEFKVFNDINKLITWLLPILGKIPRNFRHTLGLRIENTMYDITELISSYENTKSIGLLMEIDTKLKSISKFVRYAKQIRLIIYPQSGADALISHRQY